MFYLRMHLPEQPAGVYGQAPWRSTRTDNQKLGTSGNHRRWWGCLEESRTSQRPQRFSPMGAGAGFFWMAICSVTSSARHRPTWHAHLVGNQGPQHLPWITRTPESVRDKANVPAFVLLRDGRKHGIHACRAGLVPKWRCCLFRPSVA